MKLNLLFLVFAMHAHVRMWPEWDLVYPVSLSSVHAQPTSSPTRIGQLSEYDKGMILEAHNSERESYCLADMAWDENIAQIAEMYAQQCTTTGVHSNNGYGENMGGGSGFGGASQWPPVWTVGSWLQEKQFWSCTSDPSIPRSSRAGHYFAIVWNATARIGCGEAFCPYNGGQIRWLVCNYAPAAAWWASPPFEGCGCPATTSPPATLPPITIMTPPPPLSPTKKPPKTTKPKKLTPKVVPTTSQPTKSANISISTRGNTNLTSGFPVQTPYPLRHPETAINVMRQFAIFGALVLFPLVFV